MKSAGVVTPPRTLPDLKIGPVPSASRSSRAALSGYSDLAMRVIARRLGAPTPCAKWCSISSSLLERRNSSGVGRLPMRSIPSAGSSWEATRPSFRSGGPRVGGGGFDVIDINFGCPVKKVLGRCRGGFHLSQPAVALEIVRRTAKRCRRKFRSREDARAGIDDRPRGRDKFFTIFDGAFARGTAAVTVHGRTVEQRYVGPSRWGFSRSASARWAAARRCWAAAICSRPQIARHDRRNRRRWRHGSPAGHRQSVDLRPSARLGRRTAAARRRRASSNSAT